MAGDDGLARAMAGSVDAALPVVLDARTSSRGVNYTHGTLDGSPTGDKLRWLPAEEFSGKTIFGICFSCEEPDTAVFPPGTKGVTFDACNLDNVRIPTDSVVLPTCTTRRFRCNPEDGRDWHIDAAGAFVAPLDGVHALAEDGSSVAPDGTVTPPGGAPAIELPTGPDVRIDPNLVPLVQGTLASADPFLGAYGQLEPHLEGAYRSVQAHWGRLTDAQRAEFLARSPSLRAAAQKLPELAALVASAPTALTEG